MVNIPLTREQVKNLPLGFTATGMTVIEEKEGYNHNDGIYLNRRARRAIGKSPIRMNGRHLTKGRKRYRNHLFGRYIQKAAKWFLSIGLR